ncbi:hypothetical protein PMAYCL1PPCAC_26684 [Pristionchus mayeri]|uniref:Tyrosine-protein kinase n=1 Tax=Pristionchus mayeri TaxID=1317129 RepID=A0AAN5I9J2_9BILA|nr:hypothetical protein PMAYCL1PPCAC_26684 [Pristionchus mayeri]
MGDIYGTVRTRLTKLRKVFVTTFSKTMNNEYSLSKEIVIAIHPFTPAHGSTDQLAFSVGDEFLLKSDADKKWWHVKHVSTGKKGFVPMSFVVKKSELEHMEWYDTWTSRKDAERILNKEKYGPGAFIVRLKDNTQMNSALALSIKAKIEDETNILHYVITREDSEFRIGGRRFLSLTHLVHYYAEPRSGIEQHLTFSVKKNKHIDVWEVDPSDVDFNKEDRLGNGYFGEVFKGTFRGHPIAVKTVKPGRMTVQQFIKYIFSIHTSLMGTPINARFVLL